MYLLLASLVKLKIVLDEKDMKESMSTKMGDESTRNESTSRRRSKKRRMKRRRKTSR